SKPCKPGSVDHRSGISIIYLDLPSLTNSINLPIANSNKLKEDEQPSGFATYLVFQHTRFTVMYVTIQDRKLLPYVFTLTPKSGIFSVALSVCYLHSILPVRKRVALCCPDFPLLPKEQR
ncbi:MAG: hypothetical protein K0R59_4380, partial [Sphingobacterium sp.]|nr:hypothetical protein [Sphingobacterium sp.]